MGTMNVTLLKMCCNSDGKILKPDLPATPTDYEIANSPIGWDNDVVQGLFWKTKSEIHVNGDKIAWGYALSINQTGDFSIELNRLLLNSDNYYIKTTFSTNTTTYDKLISDIPSSQKVNFP